MLTISPETVCYVIIKAREFDEKVAPDIPDPGSNPIDDKGVAVLEDYADDPTLQELTGAIEALNVDQQIDLLALAWLGRGDFESWKEARNTARETRNRHVAAYIAGTPLVGDYLEEGLTMLGYSCEDVSRQHL
jgi:hypothetical protein